MNRSLRQFYNEVLGEPVPDPFLKLLNEMTAPAERGEGRRGASEDSTPPRERGSDA